MKTITLNNKTFTILRDDKRATHYTTLYKHYKKYDLYSCYSSCSFNKLKAYWLIANDNYSRNVKSHLYILSYNKNQFVTGHIETDDDNTKWLIVNTKCNTWAMVYPFND